MKTTRHNGFALPITLIVLSLLTVLSLGISQMARQDIAKIQRRQQFIKDELILKNTNQWVLYQLLIGTPDKDVKHHASYTLPVDNTAVSHNQVQIQVQDSAGLMGLYYYYPKRVEQLLKKLTDKQTAVTITAQLKDWVDKDSRSSYKGMEIAGYRKTRQPMLPRNAPIRSLDELLELPAMTAALYNGNDKQAGLRDLLLAGGVSEFNITTAPDILLGPMLGISGKKLAQIQALKKAKDWRHIRELTAKMSMFSDSSPFGQAYQYRVVLTLPNGKKSRALYRLTPSKAKPYQQKQWQYPDNDRG